MRKGFTKIPNSIIGQQWVNNPVVMYMYTWLSLNADKEGIVSMSLNELVTQTGLNKMQVRRSIEKLKSTGYVTQIPTQLTTQRVTHLPNKLCICFLSTYKEEKIDDDTTCDTASDTENDTLRAYKNDNINIMSIQDLKDKNNSSLHSELQKEKGDDEKDEKQRFEEFMKEKYPYVSKMKNPLTLEGYNKILAAGYTNKEIMAKLSDMDNFPDLRKKYVYANRTLLNWLKKDYGERHTTAS